MSRIIAWLTFTLVFAIGCDSKVDPPPDHLGSTWQAEFVTANATSPKISRDNSSFLFLREGQGLLLWRDGVESLVSPAGSSVRPDYSWSLSGEDAFAYSIPGEPSESSGIFIVDEAGVTTQAWDRGASPSYNAEENYVLCAGPAESELESGVWKIHLPTLERDRLSQEGVAPVFSGDGAVLNYLVPQPSSSGSILISKRTSDLEQLTAFSHVSEFVCSLTSEVVLVEVIANLSAIPIPPVIYRKPSSEALLLDLVAQPATNMVLLRDGGILFNHLDGDTLGALAYQIDDEAITVSDTLYDASAFGRYVIYAAGPSGISRVTLL